MAKTYSELPNPATATTGAASGPLPAVMNVRTSSAARCLLHPLRRRIVEHLKNPDSAAGVARHLRIPRQKVNYHLRELEAEGLVVLVTESRLGAGTERRLRAAARSFVLSPRLLGKLAPDLAADEGGDPPERLVAAASRVLREVGMVAEASEGAGGVSGESDGDPANAVAGDDRIIALEADLSLAGEEAVHGLAGELLAEIDRLAEKYRDPTAPVTRLVIGIHPADSGSFAGRLRAPQPPAADDE